MNPRKKISLFGTFSVIGVLLVMFLRPEKINSEFATKHFWTYKTHTQDKFDFVFYGDSRTYRGISPKIVLEGTEYTGHNFGYSEGSMSAEMMEFVVGKLDLKKKPTLIFGVTPLSFTKRTIVDNHYHQELNRSAYNVFQRYYIDKYLFPFDRMTPEELLGYRDWVTHEWTSDDGWMMCDNDKVNEFGAIPFYEKILTDNPLDTATIENFFSKVKDWTEQGIEVFAYRPPTTLEMEELEADKLGFNEAEFILRFENSGGKWLFVDKTAYQTYDGSHLREGEVPRLSREINDLMGIH